jgi:hypothetical protein
VADAMIKAGRKTRPRPPSCPALVRCGGCRRAPWSCLPPRKTRLSKSPGISVTGPSGPRPQGRRRAGGQSHRGTVSRRCRSAQSGAALIGPLWGALQSWPGAELATAVLWAPRLGRRRRRGDERATAGLGRGQSAGCYRRAAAWPTPATALASAHVGLPLIRKTAFVAQCWWEAGLTDIFA